MKLAHKERYLQNSDRKEMTTKNIAGNLPLTLLHNAAFVSFLQYLLLDRIGNLKVNAPRAMLNSLS